MEFDPEASAIVLGEVGTNNINVMILNKEKKVLYRNRKVKILHATKSDKENTLIQYYGLRALKIC